MEFDFCDPKEEDFHIIKALVHKMLDGKDFDSSVLSDLIISDVCTYSGGCAVWTPHPHDRSALSSCRHK